MKNQDYELFTEFTNMIKTIVETEQDNKINYEKKMLSIIKHSATRNKNIISCFPNNIRKFIFLTLKIYNEINVDFIFSYINKFDNYVDQLNAFYLICNIVYAPSIYISLGAELKILFSLHIFHKKNYQSTPADKNMQKYFFKKQFSFLEEKNSYSDVINYIENINGMIYTVEICQKNIIDGLYQHLKKYSKLSITNCNLIRGFFLKKKKDKLFIQMILSQDNIIFSKIIKNLFATKEISIKISKKIIPKLKILVAPNKKLYQNIHSGWILTKKNYIPAISYKFKDINNHDEFYDDLFNKYLLYKKENLKKYLFLFYFKKIKLSNGKNLLPSYDKEYLEYNKNRLTFYIHTRQSEIITNLVKKSMNIVLLNNILNGLSLKFCVRQKSFNKYFTLSINFWINCENCKINNLTKKIKNTMNNYIAQQGIITKIVWVLNKFV